MTDRYERIRAELAMATTTATTTEASDASQHRTPQRLEARSGGEAEPPSASAGGGKMAEVVRFLMGEAPLEGRWFDEPDPHVGGAYWWRKHLTEALAQQPAATSETVNVIGMPEFDGLLDHIYEHGTAAEGVIEKANAFARAVIARYAPQQPAAVDEAGETDLWRCT